MEELVENKNNDSNLDFYLDPPEQLKLNISVCQFEKVPSAKTSPDKEFHSFFLVNDDFEQQEEQQNILQEEIDPKFDDKELKPQEEIRKEKKSYDLTQLICDKEEYKKFAIEMYDKSQPKQSEKNLEQFIDQDIQENVSPDKFRNFIDIQKKFYDYQKRSINFHKQQQHINQSFQNSGSNNNDQFLNFQKNVKTQQYLKVKNLPYYQSPQYDKPLYLKHNQQRSTNPTNNQIKTVQKNYQINNNNSHGNVGVINDGNRSINNLQNYKINQMDDKFVVNINIILNQEKQNKQQEYRFLNQLSFNNNNSNSDRNVDSKKQMSSPYNYETTERYRFQNQILKFNRPLSSQGKRSKGNSPVFVRPPMKNPLNLKKPFLVGSKIQNISPHPQKDRNQSPPMDFRVKKCPIKISTDQKFSKSFLNQIPNSNSNSIIDQNKEGSQKKLQLHRPQSRQSPKQQVNNNVKSIAFKGKSWNRQSSQNKNLDEDDFDNYNLMSPKLINQQIQKVKYIKV